MPVKTAPSTLFLLITEKWEPTEYVSANESTKRSHSTRVLLGAQGTAGAQRPGRCGQKPGRAGLPAAHGHPEGRLEGPRGDRPLAGAGFSSPGAPSWCPGRERRSPFPVWPLRPGKGTPRARRPAERTKVRRADPSRLRPLRAPRRCHGARSPARPSALHASGISVTPQDWLPGKAALPSAYFQSNHVN